jgi:NADH-quinone oxidoreductase subunit N
MNDFPANLYAILPLVVLAGWACLLLLVDLFIPRERTGVPNHQGITALLAVLGLVAALVITLLQSVQVGNNSGTSAFNGMIMVDGFSIFLSVLILLSGLAGIGLAYDYLKRMGIERGEYYVLLLFSICGMLLMTQAADLIIVFLSLELLSFPLYVMAGFAVPKTDSEEAALKYFLLGAFSTGIILYGIALTFGATGQTSLSGIVERISTGQVNAILLLIGAALVLVGLGFKVAAVPFHMWTPDVYQGAPTSVTGFMAVSAKVAGFAALLRIFVLAYPSLAPDMAPVIAVISALTMLLGNLVAIAQINIKRMLAYSSIASAGYVLMALVPFGDPAIAQDGVSAAIFYLVTFAFTSFCAWAVVIMLEKAEGKGLTLDDYAGLGRKYPLLAAVMTVAMLSFIGIPPTLGFFGKFYLFQPVIAGGYYWLAIIGVLTSLISAYFYLRVVVNMYMRNGDPQVQRERWVYSIAIFSGAATLVLSIFAAPLFKWAAEAVLNL